MIFYCDNKRHLICFPYSIENLHLMADQLNIPRHWFHNQKHGYYHYDIPAKRIDEIKSKCIVVSDRQILKFIKEAKSA